MKKHPELYTLDSKGKARVWYVESDPEIGYRVISGLIDGKQAVSLPKLPTAKNVGRANETTVAEQIEIEVAALYEKRLKTDGYFENIEDISKGKPYFSPMLAKSYDGFPKGRDFAISQPKYDGYRCNVYPGNIHSREGEPYLTSPHVVESLLGIMRDHPNLVFDGELYNHELRNDFEKIQKLVSKKKNVTDEDLAVTREMVQYHVYDMFDRDEPGMLYLDRYARLASLLVKYEVDRQVVVLAPMDIVESHEQVLTHYNDYLDNEYEGQMIRLNEPYDVDKRSKHLLKHKPLFDNEFTIVEGKEGVGNWAGALKTLVVTDGNGLTSECGVAGDREANKKLFEELPSLIGTLVTVEYRGITKYNKLRFGVAKKFWRTTERRY